MTGTEPSVSQPVASSVEPHAIARTADDRTPGTSTSPFLHRGGWRGALREFVIIVAGVLAALASQAWWQNRQDRERENDYLRQLLVDTRENQRRFDAAYSEDSAAGRAITMLVSTLYGPGTLPSSDSLAKLFATHAFSASDFKPLTGTYTALLATGDLRLIRNDTLRARLVAYAAMLDAEQEKMRFFLNQAFGDPARMATAVPYIRLSLNPNLSGLTPSTRADPLRLRDDPSLSGLLFAVQVSNRNRITHLRTAQEETARLLRALEAEPSLRSVR